MLLSFTTQKKCVIVAMNVNANVRRTFKMTIEPEDFDDFAFAVVFVFVVICALIVSFIVS
jgi:hypothetical protein